MMKYNKVLASLTSAIALGVAAFAAQAETLRLGDFQATSHVVSLEGTTRWMSAVEEASDGAIKFEHFPAEQASKAGALLDAVHNGILDAALIGASYHAETLPLNSMLGLPGFYGSAEQGTDAFQTMLKEGPLRDEFLAAGVTPIFGFVLPPYQVLSKARLGSVSDWNALDVRTSGSTQAMTARALGAVGISLPGPEVYTAVERGRLDAVLFPLASVPGYKLNEVVSHISLNGSFGGYSFIMVVRSELFESLAPEVQQKMIELGAETARHVAQAQDKAVLAFAEEWKAQGIDTYNFTDEELAAMRTALEPVGVDWLDRIGGEGAAAVLETYRSLTSE